MMLRTIYRALCIGIVGFVAWGSNGVRAQTNDDVCVTKTQYGEEDIVFSPDSKYLVASWDEENGVARMWNAETGKVA